MSADPRPWLIPVAAVLVWTAATRGGWVPPSLLATPDATVNALFEQATSGRLAGNVWASVSRLVGGLAIGVGGGVLLGAVAAVSRTAAAVVSPSVRALAPVPPVTWIPLLIIAFGIDDASKVALIAAGTFFIAFANTLDGLRKSDSRLVEVGNSLCKSRWEVFTSILLRSAAGQIVLGVRLAVGLGWTLLLAAELIASSRGIGWYIWDARNFSRPADMLAGMLVVSILGGLSDLFLSRVQAHFERWRLGFEGA